MKFNFFFVLQFYVRPSDIKLRTEDIIGALPSLGQRGKVGIVCLVDDVLIKEVGDTFCADRGSTISV